MEENLNLEEKRGPGRPPKSKSEIEELRGLVDSLTSQVLELSKPKVNGSSVIRKRTKTHTATMREYSVDETPLGIVTRIYDVREVQDSQEARRYYGLCKLDVLNPKTGDMKTYKDVNYLEFLDKGRRVMVSIMKLDKTTRFETDVLKGGGGTGALMKQGPNNESVVDYEWDYEVGYTDYEYTLKVMEGEYEGEVFVHDGKGLNI